MKSLFDMAGISEKDLEDDNTRQMIYDVIEKQGGLDAVKQQVKTRNPPAPRGTLALWMHPLGTCQAPDEYPPDTCQCLSRLGESEHPWAWPRCMKPRSPQGLPS